MSLVAHDPEQIESANAHLLNSSVSEILEWSFETYGDEFALATGFGPSGIVLMHLVSRLRPETTVFYLDTGFLFDETYRLRDELADRFGLNFARIAPEITPEEQAALHGPALWEREPDQCCATRKVAPLRSFLGSYQAWATGIRRDQSRTRRNIEIVSWDQANGLIKLCPLAEWTSEDVWTYLRLHDLPYNPLHDRGFPSIGCTHCTRPVARGEDERAGRWSGLQKTECGIHLPPEVAA